MTLSGDHVKGGFASELCNPNEQNRIKLAVKAIEGFMFCAIVATGLLQMVALRFSGTDELANLRFMRTQRSTIASEATIADFMRKNFIWLLGRQPNLQLNQIISAKQTDSIELSRLKDAA